MIDCEPNTHEETCSDIPILASSFFSLREEKKTGWRSEDWNTVSNFLK
jgi:hypothetical protein